MTLTIAPHDHATSITSFADYSLKREDPARMLGEEERRGILSYFPTVEE